MKSILCFRFPVFIFALFVLLQIAAPPVVLLAGELSPTPPEPPPDEPQLITVLSLTPTEVEPGESVVFSVQWTNEGTATFEQTAVDFYASSGFTGSVISNTLTIPELLPEASAQQTMTLTVQPEVTEDQVISVYSPRLVDESIVLGVLAGAPMGGLLSITSLESDTVPEAWQPAFVSPEISAFSGAATYSYPFEVFPGRQGLQPALGLAYSSHNVNGINIPQASGNVADGWNLTGLAYIGRDEVQNCPNNPEYARIQNVYTLHLNGDSYELLPKSGTGNYGRYEAKGNPGLYIARHNPAGTYNGFDGSNGNITGEYWVVKTPDGTTYRFGHDYDSEQITFNLLGPDEACSLEHDDPGFPYVGSQLNTL